jgi:hypothetical protein
MFVERVIAVVEIPAWFARKTALVATERVEIEVDKLVRVKFRFMPA